MGFKSTEKSETIAGYRSLFLWGERTYLMGVLNVTPDSFSGDGLIGRPESALSLALDLETKGADILDVGAESTRPGHVPISDEEEIIRLIPVLEAISSRVNVPISIDTYKAGVAEVGLKAGATIINDVTGLNADPKMACLVADYDAAIVLVHNGPSMETPDIVAEVKKGLLASIEKALRSGIANEHIIIDPGIGFGKTPDQNLQILRRLSEIKDMGFPLLVGTSRKSTIGLIIERPVGQRIEGTAASVALAIAGGADIVRVHDVEEMCRVARMSDAIVRDWRPRDWTM